MIKHFTLTMLSTVLAASLLSACGGGSDSMSAATATVSGTAATGAAIAGGSVSMNCVSGASGTTTTGTDGSFSISVSGITFPCVARVTVATGEKLHSYVAAAGTANITPVTELLVASLTGGTALDAFDKFDATKVKALTAAQVTAAIAAVKAYLVTLGVSVTDFPADPIGAKFVAKAGATAGDKVDAVLDDLAARLKAVGKKLGDAVMAVAKATASGTTTTATTTTTASGGDNVLTVSAATKTSRNGAYAITGGRYTNNPPNLTDFGFTGNTKDGNFEMDVSVTAAGVIRSATIWYYEDANHVISFFGCGGTSAVTCSAVSFDAATQKVSINNAQWSLFPAAGAVAVAGAETLTVNGTIVIK